MRKDYTLETEKQFRENLTQYETREDYRKICVDLYNDFIEAVESIEYQAILKEENSRWEEVFCINHDITPAAGLNYEKFWEHLNEKFCQKVGIPSNALKNTYVPLPAIDVEYGYYHSNFTSTDMPSYVPNDIDNICTESVNRNEPISEFINRINEECSIFERESPYQARLMFFDIIFTCMEKFFTELPDESRIDANYKDSLYVNPDFPQDELAVLFPFYIPQYDEIGETLAGHAIQKVEKNEQKVEELSDEAEYPVSVKSWEKVSGEFNRELRQYRKSHYPSKIMKAWFPLYLFTYNNILFNTIQNPQSVISKMVGCKFIGIEWDVSSLVDSLKLGIKSYTYKHRNKDMGNDKQKDILIETQLYALRRFHLYTEWIYRKHVHELRKEGSARSNDFLCRVALKKGNKKEPPEFCIIEGDSNSALTAWLFIKHSDLFKIALMPKIEDSYSSLQPQIIFPTNFLTAFNFSTAALKIYPQFFQKYNLFIQETASQLLKKYHKFGFREWLDISNCLDATFPMGCYEIERVNDILFHFFEAIKYQIPESPNKLYTFDGEKFREYFKMSRSIEKALQKSQKAKDRR